MSNKTDDRPVPRKRAPRPAPDAERDPMDTAPATTAPSPKPAKSTSRPRNVTVTPKPDIDSRAVVQLGVRVSVEVDDHLAAVVAATGRTKRELVELAILSLDIP